MKINYFLSTWSGKRREGHISGENLAYQHIQCLKELDHNISQITIGWPNNPEKSKNYADWMTSLHGTKIGKAEVVIEKMENEGYSYCQYSAMFDRHDGFDYYIFTEDDYVPIQHNFDSMLLEHYLDKKCGYLCGLVQNKPEFHAAISWGITSKDVLTSIKAKNDQLPFLGKCSQIVFSKGFIDSDFSIEDVLDKYYVCYHKSKSTIEYFGDSDNPVLIATILYVKEKNCFNMPLESPF